VGGEKKKKGGKEGKGAKGRRGMEGEGGILCSCNFSLGKTLPSTKPQ